MPQVIPRGEERRTQLFSATMTNKVQKLQRACLVAPVKVEVASKYSTVDTLRQQVGAQANIVRAGRAADGVNCGSWPAKV